MGIEVFHYSVSIIRDRGIDPIALDYILNRHSPESLLFVDGWTAKGAIAKELHRSIEDYNNKRSSNLNPKLLGSGGLGRCGRYRFDI